MKLRPSLLLARTAVASSDPQGSGQRTQPTAWTPAQPTAAGLLLGSSCAWGLWDVLAEHGLKDFSGEEKSVMTRCLRIEDLGPMRYQV